MNAYTDFSKFAGMLVVFFLLIFWFACHMAGLSMSDVMESIQTLAGNADQFILDYIAQVIAQVK